MQLSWIVAVSFVAVAAAAAEPPAAAGVAGDAVIRRAAGGSEIVITTTSRLAGAIHSLTWKALNRLTSMTRPNLLNRALTSSSLAERSTLAKNSCTHTTTGGQGCTSQQQQCAS